MCNINLYTVLIPKAWHDSSQGRQVTANNEPYHKSWQLAAALMDTIPDDALSNYV